MSEDRFIDRRQAGQVLADAVLTTWPELQNIHDGLILALPRGGVPVALPLARRLGWPCDVLVVRKLGLPQNPEVAFGAVALGGVVVYNKDVMAQVDLSQSTVDTIVHRETTELLRREQSYRAGRPPLSVAGKTVIIVDDGLATGATARAAVAAVRAGGAGQVLLAVPVAAQDTAQRMRGEVRLVAVKTPEYFDAVGQFYRDFDEITDDDVVRMLRAQE